MNQILDYSPNKGSKKSSSSDKIVNFFAIIMIIFALALIGGAGYNLYRNKNSSTKTPQNEIKANIQVEQQESQAIIKVIHTKSIEKVIYSWNSEKETTEKASGETELELTISLPSGENTLNIKVIDIDGGESTYTGTFLSETGEDITKPTIEIEVTDEKKIKIVATDETSLDFITYRWNDEQEVKVEATEENRKRIEVEIEILKGVNNLSYSAVDSNNNTSNSTKSFTGLIKPEIIIVVSADKKTAQVTVKHENGLKEIKLNLNNIEYPVPLSEENQKEIMFDVNLADGINNMVVTALSVDNTETVASEEVDNTPQITPEEPVVNNEEVQISIEKTEDGLSAYYKASHTSGIKEVKLNINDMDFDLSALGELGENRKDIEFLVPLYDGNNRITFTVIPVEGTEKQEIKEIVK